MPPTGTLRAALAACVALMVAAIAAAAWLLRAGTAVAFFSETVLVGDSLRRTGFETKHGESGQTVDLVVSKWEAAQAAAAGSPRV